MDHRTRTSPENARFSTGPRTAEGKQRSAQNARKHGAYAQQVILPGEDAAAFAHLVAWHFATYRPEGPLEERIVRQMAFTFWRLERLPAAETTVLGVQMQRLGLTNPEEMEGAGPETLFALAYVELLSRNQGLDRMNREERRLIRHLASLKAELQELQLRRPATPPDEDENAETNLNPLARFAVAHPGAGIYAGLPGLAPTPDSIRPDTPASSPS